ncbi:MAG: hypothetical protein AB1515_02170 [Nitrospirota bacterium]
MGRIDGGHLDRLLRFLHGVALSFLFLSHPFKRLVGHLAFPFRHNLDRIPWIADADLNDQQNGADDQEIEQGDIFIHDARKEVMAKPSVIVLAPRDTLA